MAYFKRAEFWHRTGKGTELLRIPMPEVEADLKGLQGADAAYRQ